MAHDSELRETRSDVWWRRGKMSWRIKVFDQSGSILLEPQRMTMQTCWLWSSKVQRGRGCNLLCFCNTCGTCLASTKSSAWRNAADAAEHFPVVQRELRQVGLKNGILCAEDNHFAVNQPFLTTTSVRFLTQVVDFSRERSTTSHSLFGSKFASRNSSGHGIYIRVTHWRADELLYPPCPYHLLCGLNYQTLFLFLQLWKTFLKSCFSVCCSALSFQRSTGLELHGPHTVIYQRCSTTGRFKKVRWEDIKRHSLKHSSDQWDTIIPALTRIFWMLAECY